ncbi:3-oxoacyl-[acyl-carrier-protein] reductase OS=Ureibacillus acetophenoni OX=614649 GN=SAMN05877842_101438 PE=3 SV=1 [Ureibacillus acetophenoni]
MYAASKAAIEAFSKTLAREWGSKGIRSNCVVPGFMETAISANLTEDQKERIYQRTSLKKETDISSVASTVLFLLSDKAKSITGAVVHVDNGTI